MPLDIKPLDIQPMGGAGKPALDIRPLDIQPMDEGPDIGAMSQPPNPSAPVGTNVPSRPFNPNNEVMGAGEALWNLGSGAASTLYHQWRNVLQGQANDKDVIDRSAETVYQPRTEEGQRDAKLLGELFNQIGIPLMGVGPIAPRPYRAGKAVKGKAIPLPKAVEAAKALDIQPLDLADQGGGRSANPYIPSSAKLMMDENGIPIRQDLSEAAVSHVQPDMFVPESQVNHAQWVEQMRRDAETRRPGNNTPMDFTSPYPVDVNEFPQTLKEPPRPQEGLDLSQDTANRMARPLEQEIANPPLRPEEATFEGEGGGQVATSGRAPNPAEAYWNGGNVGPARRVPSGQRGAVNMDIFNPAFEKARMINDGIRLVLKGGFQPIITAVDRFGKEVGTLKLAGWDSDNMTAAWVESHKPGLAKQMYKFAAELGNDIVPSPDQTAKGQAMWGKFVENGTAIPDNRLPFARPDMPIRIPAKQRGGIDFDAVTKGLEGLRNKIFTPREEAVNKILGTEAYIPRGDKPEVIVQRALAEGKDGPSLFTHTQSGLANAAEKTGSALQSGVARWLHYGEKVGDHFNTKVVAPIAKSFARLSRSELVDVMQVMRNEMESRARYGADELATHLSPKGVEAYHLMRKAFDDVLRRTNEALVKMGRPEIDPHEAYMASTWDGDYHIPVKKGGSLVWYVRAQTRAEAVKAVNWIKKNTDLDVSPADIKYRAENVGRKVPRDILGAYHEMLQFFKDDPGITKNIEEAIQRHTQEEGFKFMGHNVHFYNKAGVEGVRGYLGDRPWLDEHTNAIQGAKAQIRYLNEAYRWAPMNEALANVKQILGNADLAKQQPNNMKLARLYTAQAMGVTRNLFGEAEKILQKFTSRIPGAPKKISEFVSSIKDLTYLTQLGANLSYMIATPLQAFILGPSWHLKTGVEGTMSAAFKSMADLGGLFGKPVTELGKEAYTYMRDNGIIDQNVFHENAGLGSYAPVRMARSTLGQTIALPEKLARAATFLSFAHHLDALGVPKPELFARAEELTNHTLTDFRRSSRPLVVDTMGQMGELMYTYKSSIFNYFNNLSVFGRDAMNGKPGPLLAAIGMTGLLAGFSGLPLVNEADGAWNLVKEWVAKNKPNWYPSIRDINVKGSVVQNIRSIHTSQLVKDTLSNGLPSALTGVQLGSRFSAETGDVKNPLNGVAPAIQELKELVSSGKAAVNPTSTNAAEALWQQMPGAGKGLMENQNIPGTQWPAGAMQSIKQGDKQGMLNPNHLSEAQTTYFRTPKEQMMRYGGMTSLQEAQTKNDWYDNNLEKENWKTAQKSSVDKFFNAVLRKDKGDIQKYAQAYLLNYGDQDSFDKSIDSKIEAYTEDPRQRAMIKAQTLSEIMAVKRYLDRHEGVRSTPQK